MKAKMPEPVAEVCSGYQLFWAGFGGIAAICEHNNVKVGSLLITTDQAEAYKNACVREALEEAAQEANDWSMQYVEVDTAPKQVGDYIRALIPQHDNE